MADMQDNGNWYFVVFIVGFVILIGFNFQFFECEGVLDEIINIFCVWFFLDEDGFEDVLFIDYIIDQLGYIVNVWIFDV